VNPRILLPWIVLAAEDGIPPKPAQSLTGERLEENHHGYDSLSKWLLK
jgi:hypothetical protein